ncbi:hypothetical protein D3C86_1379680 [compost metagenome]
MNDSHELPTNPGTLVLRVDKDASDNVPIQTGRRDDTLVDRRHINPALRHQLSDPLPREALLHSRDDIGWIVLRIGLVQRADHHMTDRCCIVGCCETNLTIHFAFPRDLCSSNRKRIKALGIR